MEGQDIKLPGFRSTSKRMKRAELGLLEVLGLVVNAGGECVVGS
jgi:hypothetical protein